MRVSPVYQGPAAPVPPPAQHPAAVPEAAAGDAAAAMVLGQGAPVVTVDHRAAVEIKRQVNEQLIKEAKRNPTLGDASGTPRQQRARALINERVMLWADGEATRTRAPVPPGAEQALASLVFDMLFRAGRLQRLLDDDRIEDIYINGHDRVSVKLAGGTDPVPTEPVAESEEELQELVRDLIRTSGQGGRTFSTAAPEVALRLRDGSRLQAIGPEITGGSTYVTIRRHRLLDSNLADLVRRGMLDQGLADLLAAAVRARRNLIIVGEQSAGKSSMLRALLREIPQHERFGTIETEFELWAHRNGYHTQVVPMEARESNGERVGGRAAGEITPLDLMYRAKRMSLTRTILGEVRGPEITAMMQAMTSDRPGNMCTMHASEPHAVFDRIAELYLLARGNFSEQLAYRQIANGLHFVVFLSVAENGTSKQRFVSHVWELSGIGEGGRPAYNEVYGPASDWDQRAVPRTPLSPSMRRRLAQVGYGAGEVVV
ncbi:CpaF family protein [Streptomyces albidoflavus]